MSALFETSSQFGRGANVTCRGFGLRAVNTREERHDKRQKWLPKHCRRDCDYDGVCSCHGHDTVEPCRTYIKLSATVPLRLVPAKRACYCCRYVDSLGNTILC